MSSHPKKSSLPQNGERKAKKSTGGVRFSESSQVVDENGESTTATQQPPRRQKRPRQERPNVDEMDDIDEYNLEEEEEKEGNLPRESETLHAKRQRRLRGIGDEEENDHASDKDDRDTSLASEGIAVEPFHMKEEKSDGMGYFDGDTYIFRKNDGGRNPNEEEDAWLDNLQQGTNEEDQESKSAAKSSTTSRSSNNNAAEKMDAMTKEELYAQILPLISDTETISKALIRYGNLIKQQQKQKKGNQKNDSHDDMAKQALNNLTEAASALLLKGDVSIYQQTRQDIMKIVSPPSQTAKASVPKTPLQWQYKGNQDFQIHGPYTTPQMQGWIQHGYFTGPTAVQVRTVQEPPAEQKSLEQDLLSDLMDDDDDNEADKANGSEEKVYGEWILSDHVDFSQYA